MKASDCKRREETVRVTELDVASSGVTSGVRTLSLIPVAVAVI